MRWTQNKDFLLSRCMKFSRNAHPHWIFMNLENKRGLIFVFSVHRILIYVFHTHFVRGAKVRLFCSPQCRHIGTLMRVNQTDTLSCYHHESRMMRQVCATVLDRPGQFDLHVSIEAGLACKLFDTTDPYWQHHWFTVWVGQTHRHALIILWFG